MSKFSPSLVVVMLLGLCGSAGAGMLGDTPITVDCGTTIAVTDANAFQTLTLDASDPILSTVCKGDGITIKNQAGGKTNRGLTLDCQGNQLHPITGSTKGVGIKLVGANLVVLSCYVDSFNQGLTVSGDGADIEDSQVQNSAADGFVLTDPVGLKSPILVGTNFVGNRAIKNGGWGFNLKGNVMSIGTGSVFNNFASENGLGGFLVTGEGVGMFGNEAFKNTGPGFSVTSNNCCSGAFGEFFSAGLAVSNAGPGIIFSGRNDGSNCVGGTDEACTGGTFFPAGLDASPGALVSVDNGATCPNGSIPFLPGVCPIVKGKQCKQAALDKC
jgi:hypothetical protein